MFSKGTDRSQEPGPTRALTALRRLRWLDAAAVFSPVAILVVCFGLNAVNKQAGWQRFPLPWLLAWGNVAAALASPLAGLFTLGVLGARRKQLWWVSGEGERRVRDHVVALAVAAVLAPGLWLALAPFVLLSAGFSR